MVALKNK